MTEEILYMERICTAENRSNLNYFSLSVEKGEIHLVTGTDESGIYLLADLLTGQIQPSSGSIYYGGAEIQFFSRIQSEREGIFYISSDLPILSELTLTENLSYKKPIGWRRIYIQKKENEYRADELFKKYGLNLTVNTPIDRLTRAQSYELLICRAILCGAKFLICQGIGEGFSDYETEEVRKFLLRLKDEGISFLMLNVNIESAMSFADNLSVMRDGMICYSEKIKDVSLYSVYKCLEANRYTGDKLIDASRGGSEIRFVVTIRQKETIVFLRICLRAGSITGLLIGEAFVGARENLLYRVFSGMELVRGSVLQNGKEISFGRWIRKNREELCYLGVRFWECNVFHELEVGDNIVLHAISRYKGRWTKALEMLMLQEFAERYNIKIDFSKYPKQLSTGEYNQIVLWRLLFYPPRYLVLSYPMFGADEPLREKILETLNVLKKNGTYILWVDNNVTSLEKYCPHIVYPEFS